MLISIDRTHENSLIVLEEKKVFSRENITRGKNYLGISVECNYHMIIIS